MAGQRGGGAQNIKTKNAVIPALCTHLREIGEIYAFIFLTGKKMSAIRGIRGKISTKNAANGDEHAYIRIIRT
ncbi:hypothetical protein P4H42_04175 [Paenibacillus macerans]|uniref:hypothetical protein n=1 Tax=Paenibacillus macerans TaxID=44252 RepID=UPI000AF872D7|nr:hypothetical protein [Paenibacillus macerans]MEC0328819.1 hypothetical protein [Paenibacillus macerans]